MVQMKGKEQEEFIKLNGLTMFPNTEIVKPNEEKRMSTTPRSDMSRNKVPTATRYFPIKYVAKDSLCDTLKTANTFYLENIQNLFKEEVNAANHNRVNTTFVHLSSHANKVEGESRQEERTKEEDFTVTQRKVSLDFSKELYLTDKLTFDEEFHVHDILARRREEALLGFQRVYHHNVKKFKLQAFFNNLCSKQPKLIDNGFLFAKKEVEETILMQTCSSIYPGLLIYIKFLVSYKL